jgi:hypothetical protein
MDASESDLTDNNSMLSSWSRSFYVFQCCRKDFNILFELRKHKLRFKKYMHEKRIATIPYLSNQAKSFTQRDSVLGECEKTDRPDILVYTHAITAEASIGSFCHNSAFSGGGC